MHRLVVRSPTASGSSCQERWCQPHRHEKKTLQVSPSRLRRRFPLAAKASDN
ncbi:MAG: hypothetical protein KatS3mg111_1785 [Pirellulaceae bacterium]|nr:MAG: hypothetical protein KatS3mg111_1785 [Pirellulaceae bacterium]